MNSNTSMINCSWILKFNDFDNNSCQSIATEKSEVNVNTSLTPRIYTKLLVSYLSIEKSHEPAKSYPPN